MEVDLFHPLGLSLTTEEREPEKRGEGQIGPVSCGPVYLCSVPVKFIVCKILFFQHNYAAPISYGRTKQSISLSQLDNNSKWRRRQLGSPIFYLLQLCLRREHLQSRPFHHIILLYLAPQDGRHRLADHHHHLANDKTL